MVCNVLSEVEGFIGSSISTCGDATCYLRFTVSSTSARGGAAWCLRHLCCARRCSCYAGVLFMRGCSDRFKVHKGFEFYSVGQLHAVVAVIQLLCQRRLLLRQSFLHSFCVPCYCYCLECLKRNEMERERYRLLSLWFLMLSIVDRELVRISKTDEFLPPDAHPREFADLTFRAKLLHVLSTSQNYSISRDLETPVPWEMNSRLF